jgi:hypothetical protein
MSSQKVISFVFAAVAIFIVLTYARAASVMTAELGTSAITAIKEMAIALLVVRGGQSAASFFANKKNGKEEVDCKEVK